MGDRANYIGAPGMFHLQNACLLINEAFGEDGYGCYLVGSSLIKRDYRDVDVRYIMKDEDFKTLFPGCDEDHSWMHARWSLINTAIADQLSRQTGLPVDFQIQSQTYANRKFSRKDGHQRSALGWFLTNKAEDSPLPSVPERQQSESET